MTDINAFAKKVESDLIAVNPAWATFPFGTEKGILGQYEAIPNGNGSIIYYYPKETNAGYVLGTMILRIGGEVPPDLGEIPVLPEPVPPPPDGTRGRIHFGVEGPEDPLTYPFWWDTEEGELRIWYVDVDTGQWVDIVKDVNRTGVHIGDSPPTDTESTPFWWDSDRGELCIWYVDVDSGQWVDINKRSGFQTLFDTPISYVGFAGYQVIVNATEDGLIFAAAGAGSGDMTKAIYDPNNVNGNVYNVDLHISGTTNKVFTLTEQSKLSGIEDNATADQTPVQIKAAYEGNANTNAFTDANQTLLGNQSGTNTGDQDLSGYADLTTAQTINGVKTFGSFPVTPASAPTTDYQVANKKYVDDNAGGGGSAISVEDEGTEITAGVTTFDFVGAGVSAASVANKVTVTISGGGGAGSIEVEDEGVSLTTAVTKFNFAGAGVTVTEPSADEMLVTIPSGAAGSGSVTVMADTAPDETLYVDGDRWVRTTDFIEHVLYEDTPNVWVELPSPIPQIIESFALALSDESSQVSSGTQVTTFRLPYAFTLTEVRASCTTAPTGTTRAEIDINVNGVTIMDVNKIHIDLTEKTSLDAVTQPVLTTFALADDDEITIDLDQVGDTNSGTGYKVYIKGYQTGT